MNNVNNILLCEQKTQFLITVSSQFVEHCFFTSVYLLNHPFKSSSESFSLQSLAPWSSDLQMKQYFFLAILFLVFYGSVVFSTFLCLLGVASDTSSNGNFRFVVVLVTDVVASCVSRHLGVGGISNCLSMDISGQSRAQ